MKNYGVYIHIPFCRSRCDYCSFCTQTDYSLEQKYFAALRQEIESYKPGAELIADSVYFGGGTPASVDSGLIAATLDAVRKRFTMLSGSEISIEANPGNIDAGKARAFAAAGINRFSLGLQSADDGTLKKIGRTHTCADFVRSVQEIRGAGASNISADLMLGLPGESAEDIGRSADLLIDLGVNHVSAYALTVEEGTPMHRSGYRPDEDESADQYDYLLEKLAASGYARYEVSNFALRGYECRHNLKYWDLSPYAGFGVSAHGFDGSVRRANTSDLQHYIDGLGRPLTAQRVPQNELKEEYIMLGLRTAAGIDTHEYTAMFGKSFDSEFSSALKKCSGSLERDGNNIRLKQNAFYIMNSVIVELLRCLPQI